MDRYLPKELDKPMEDKTSLRETLAADVEAFLSNKGAYIQELPMWVTGEEVAMIQCRKCHEMKPSTHFSDPWNPNRNEGNCISCRNKAGQTGRHRNPKRKQKGRY